MVETRRCQNGYRNSIGRGSLRRENGFRRGAVRLRNDPAQPFSVRTACQDVFAVGQGSSFKPLLPQNSFGFRNVGEYGKRKNSRQIPPRSDIGDFVCALPRTQSCAVTAWVIYNSGRGIRDAIASLSDDSHEELSPELIVDLMTSALVASDLLRLLGQPMPVKSRQNA